MTHIFYFFIIFAIFFEIVNIQQPQKVSNFINKIRITPFDDLDGRQHTVGILLLLYSFYCYFGIMTSQWVLFSIVPFLSLMPKKRAWVRAFWAVLKLSILMFILINKYHLQIDIYHVLFDAVQ